MMVHPRHTYSIGWHMGWIHTAIHRKHILTMTHKVLVPRNILNTMDTLVKLTTPRKTRSLKMKMTSALAVVVMRATMRTTSPLETPMARALNRLATTTLVRMKPNMAPKIPIWHTTATASISSLPASLVKRGETTQRIHHR